MTVACVNCKKPVTVSAINGVRCNECYVLQPEDLNSRFAAMNEPLDMLIAENKRLWEAINTLQRENLAIMLKLQLMDPKVIDAKIDNAFNTGWAAGHAYED